MEYKQHEPVAPDQVMELMRKYQLKKEMEG